LPVQHAGPVFIRFFDVGGHIFHPEFLNLLAETIAARKMTAVNTDFACNVFIFILASFLLKDTFRLFINIGLTLL
jgi:hypothetical protein